MLDLRRWSRDVDEQVCQVSRCVRQRAKVARRSLRIQDFWILRLICVHAASNDTKSLRPSFACLPLGQRGAVSGNRGRIRSGISPAVDLSLLHQVRQRRHILDREIDVRCHGVLLYLRVGDAGRRG